jgi:6-pyruvoyltetrahydropterin/6-carboxytetrahydropterin synthase
MLIRKLFKAEMAHLVPGAYTARCHHLHGHSYKFELFLASSQPNDANMVADFKAIKDMGINDFFDTFDHAVMIWKNDPLAKIAHQLNPERHLIVPFVPTAEMIAKACFLMAQAIFESGPKLSGEKDARVHKVIVHETDTGYAVFGEEDLGRDQFPSIAFDEWVISDGIKAAWKDKSWYTRVRARFAASPSAS